MILPSVNKVEQHELYYRANGDTEVEYNEIKLAPQTRVRFDTYFNAFFYPKYSKYTCISKVSMCALVTGELWARAICWTAGKEEILLFETRVSGREQSVSFPVDILHQLPQDGAICLELEVISGYACFHKGWYETDAEPNHQVRLAAIICTYKREDYVSRSLNRLRTSIWETEQCPIKEDIDVLVIDNGNTLIPNKEEHVRILGNRNLGGSGGFTRGLIEAYCQKDKYTHVLFMDDDISFETETLVRTVQILKFAKKFEEPLWIGGQMLVEGQPSIQFESGAFYRKGRLVPVNRGLDLSERENLLENEKEHHVQYNAWWYCCFPVECVEEKGLPLPLFIKTDDVEYGLRVKPRVLLMNGIGIWHMAFTQKYSPYLEYYIKRNELIVSALHNNGDGVWAGLWKMLRAAGKAILTGELHTVLFITRAYRDFLAGPEFLASVDGEQLNTALRNEPISKNGFIEAITVFGELLKMTACFCLGYSNVRKRYLLHLEELVSLSSWCTRLGIEDLFL